MKPWRVPNRAGQSLVEFAVVALALYLLLAAILTFGHMLYVAQGLQGAADLAAREISRSAFHAVDPLTSEPLTFEELFVESVGTVANPTDNDILRSEIFDPAYLVIDLKKFYEANPQGNVFVDIGPQLPLLNQQLLALMIVDRPDDGNTQAWYLRYPGALLSRDEYVPPAGKTYEPYVVLDKTVGIPLVTTRTDEGYESIRWIPIVEEIDSEDQPSDDTSPNPDPFAFNSSQGGIVALRINYPFQSASMSSFRHDKDHPDYPFEATVGRPNLANDDNVTQSNSPAGGLTNLQLTDGEVYSGTYGGKFGLGAQGAFGQIVRPYRRVITAQAIYRREIFSN